MKKFFMFAAMASVALASCTKNEPVATVEQGDAILFNSPVVAPATKATNNADAIAFPHDDFGAYAWYAEEDYTGSDEQLYLKNRTFVDKTGYWGTDNAYWPKNGKLTFVAYAPVTDGPTVDEANTGASKLVVSYTVKDVIGEQVDVLYSDWVENKSSKDVGYSTENKFGDAGVDIPFHHALSAVKFQMKAATTAVAPLMKIKGITLSGVDKTGTLTVPYDGTPRWSNGELQGATYTVLADAEIEFDDEEIVNLNTGTQFILLPQNGTANLNVDYFIKADGGDWLPQSTSTPIELPMDWQIGTRYTYTLVFSLDEIKLAPVVAEDWTDKDPALDDVAGVL